MLLTAYNVGNDDSTGSESSERRCGKQLYFNTHNLLCVCVAVYPCCQHQRSSSHVMNYRLKTKEWHRIGKEWSFFLLLSHIYTALKLFLSYWYEMWLHDVSKHFKLRTIQKNIRFTEIVISKSTVPCRKKCTRLRATIWWT